MWGPWRLTLRKAEHALKIGRLDEAVAYVSRPEVRSYRQARELKVRVAEALAGRAEEHLRGGDSQRAWNDLDQAQSLDGAHDRIGQVRQQLVRQGLDEATQYINAGQPEAALNGLDKLAKRGVNGADTRRLHEAAAAWRTGRDQARLGRLPVAIEQLEKARALLPDCEPLENAVQQAWAARDRLATLETELHRAMAGDDWSAALATADEILSIAPEHIQARAARRRAWQAVGAPVSVGAGGRVVGPKFHNDPRAERTVIRPPGSPLILDDAANPAEPEPDAAQQAGQRFLLWIDGVGGYLVCMGDRVSIGQPAGWHVDIPIMADLSRLHAWIERDAEGYSLRAVRPAAVQGRSVREKAVLGDDVQLVLGQGTRLRFRQPSPLSRTARLDIESPHRLSLPAEGVVLMAETFIIGAKSNSHIVAPGWKTEVVLFRQGDELWCRAAGDFAIDDVTCHDRGRLTLSSRIKGEGFSLALEAI